MISLESKTKYFAQRRVIRAAIEYFIQNENARLCKIESTYEGGQYTGFIKKADLIKLTFNFMTPSNKQRLFDGVYWNKNLILSIFSQLRLKHIEAGASSPIMSVNEKEG